MRSDAVKRRHARRSTIRARIACVSLCVLASVSSRRVEATLTANADEIQAHKRSLKQFLAPVRYSMVPFRDALYNLGEAIVDLALVPHQFRWVDEINARAAEYAENDYDEYEAVATESTEVDPKPR